MIRRAGAHLYLECEALRHAGFGQQLLRLLGIVREQLLDGVRHRLERLEVAHEVGVLWIGKQFGVTPVIFLHDLLLVDREVECAPNSNVVERLGIDTERDKLAEHRKPFRPLQLRRVLLQLFDRGPANVLHYIKLTGAQCRQRRRLVLDGPKNDFVHERELGLDAADLLGIPVDRVLDVGVRVALHEIGKLKRPGAVDILPVYRRRRPRPLSA